MIDNYIILICLIILLISIIAFTLRIIIYVIVYIIYSIVKRKYIKISIKKFCMGCRFEPICNENKSFLIYRVGSCLLRNEMEKDIIYMKLVQKYLRYEKIIKERIL